MCSGWVVERWGGVQARSQLVKLNMNESNSMEQGSFHSPEQQAIMATTLKYCKLIVGPEEAVRALLALPLLVRTPQRICLP